jgi:hypothetical protein
VLCGYINVLEAIELSGMRLTPGAAAKPRRLARIPPGNRETAGSRSSKALRVPRGTPDALPKPRRYELRELRQEGPKGQLLVLARERPQGCDLSVDGALVGAVAATGR